MHANLETYLLFYTCKHMHCMRLKNTLICGYQVNGLGQKCVKTEGGGEGEDGYQIQDIEVFYSYVIFHKVGSLSIVDVLTPLKSCFLHFSSGFALLNEIAALKSHDMHGNFQIFCANIYYHK